MAAPARARATPSMGSSRAACPPAAAAAMGRAAAAVRATAPARPATERSRAPSRRQCRPRRDPPAGARVRLPGPRRGGAGGRGGGRRRHHRAPARGPAPYPGARRRGIAPTAPHQAEPRDGGDRRGRRLRAPYPPRRRVPRAGAARGAHHRGWPRYRAARAPGARRRRAPGRGRHPREPVHRPRRGAAPGERGRARARRRAAHRRLRQRARAGRGRPGARAAARVLRARLGRPRGPVVVVCGRGNNGGDGFVVARHLRRARIPVEVWLAANPEDVRGDAAGMLAAWRRGRNALHDLTGRGRVEALASRLARTAVVVDALLGTGLNAPVSGLAAAVIEAVNRWAESSGRPVLAIDVGSGLAADSGRPLGVAIRATVTATFGCAKIGQVVYPGIDYTGILDVVDIGIPPAALAAVHPRTSLLERGEGGRLLPPRPRDAHKGTFGHVLVIGGSRGKTGAALLAAEGAARAGAGLTTLAVPAALQPVLEGRVRELMTAALGDLDTLLAGRAAAVCGPGRGAPPDT